MTPLGTLLEATTGTPYEIPLVGRAMLAEVFAERGYTKGAEVGVWEGEHAASVCQVNPQLHLLCVDAWAPYPGYADHQTAEELERAYRKALTTLQPYRCSLMKMFSVEAATRVPDRSLDFVYLDANHTYEGLWADLEAWVPKVKVGGLIAGHDYHQFRRSRGIRVIEAVQQYTHVHNIKPWFVLGRRQDQTQPGCDGIRSFVWVHG
jgi:hypothetical protein